jgi:hypothetical protein
MAFCNPKDIPMRKRPPDGGRKLLIGLMGLPRLERGTYCLGDMVANAPICFAQSLFIYNT